MRYAPLLVATACATALVSLGCGRSGPTSGLPQDADAPFDVETMAFLSEARALHHEANVSEESGDDRLAIATVARIVHARRPSGAPPEVEEVLADAYARLAELELRAGDRDAALRDAREGLTHAATTTYFRGHLLEVEGVIEESRATNLADAGDSAGAARARSSSMRLLEEAVSVQARVIEGALDGGTVRETHEEAHPEER